ncbi:conserved exported hypothetical protein [metagenome]|uniref:Putative Flp pilus-assembly TadG-like N-terminal domain-containing protein n=1 Tax=metagenome TaxID=256318 RepID=A0A2P2CC03_9ZZZZ
MTGERAEHGQVSLMIVGFMLVIVLVIAAITDASAAYLQHSGLDTVADGAALAGADALDAQVAYAGGVGDTPALDARLAEARIRDYLATTRAHERFSGLTVHSSVVDNTIVVRVQARLDLPLPLPGTEDSAIIAATGAAELDPLAAG